MCRCRRHLRLQRNERVLRLDGESAEPPARSWRRCRPFPGMPCPGSRSQRTEVLGFAPRDRQRRVRACHGHHVTHAGYSRHAAAHIPAFSPDRTRALRLAVHTLSGRRAMDSHLATGTWPDLNRANYVVGEVEDSAASSLLEPACRSTTELVAPAALTSVACACRAAARRGAEGWFVAPGGYIR